MAMAICSDYTPVRARRGRTVHALPWTSRQVVCADKAPGRGYVVTDQPLNCTACMARLVGLIKARARKARRAAAAAP